jgi:hypothetical protein
MRSHSLNESMIKKIQVYQQKSSFNACLAKINICKNVMLQIFIYVGCSKSIRTTAVILTTLVE